jgi:L-fuconolactonase
MRIDAHQHFWVYRPDEYPWITDRLAALRRDFLPEHLAPLRTAAAIDGSIAVQARQSLEESRWLLGLAERHPSVLGVVGWVDLCSDAVDEPLRELSGHPKFVGVRHVVQDEPDDRFLLRPDFLRGVGRLRAFGLTYDLLIYPRQLPAALPFVRHFPDQPIVLDHLAKPAVTGGGLSPWREQVRELARAPNVCCKLSGLVTEADWLRWRAEDFRPYLDVALEAFGEDRLMFGSDWPVCLLAAGYEQVSEIIARFTEGLGETARQKIFGDSAARFYGIGGTRTT